MKVAPWTPAMQALWDRAMLVARTRGAYGCAFPMPGTRFSPPTEGTMLYDLIFCCVADDAEYEAHLAEIREDMLAWKERVRNSGHKRRELVTKVNLSGVDLTKVEFKL